jgi:moderate conductance mechanosensitive channel
VAEELRADPVHALSILEPIEIFGVDGFKEGSLVIKARLKTRPIQQWTVGREYRRRLVHAFAAEGIDIPPRVMQVVEPGKPLPVLLMHGVGPDQPAALPH